jgi:hypothetical protein
MSIRTAPAPADAAMQHDATTTQQPGKSRPRRGLIAAAVVVAVAVLALLGGIGVWDRNSDGPSDASPAAAGATPSPDLTQADLIVWAGIDYGSLASSR